ISGSRLSQRKSIVPFLRKCVISSPSIAWTRPPAGGSHGNLYPTTRIHIHAVWRGGIVAARDARAARDETANRRLSSCGYAFNRKLLDGRLFAAAARTRLDRGSHCHY